MKKVTSLILMACFLTHAAFAGTSNHHQQKIAKVLNEYRYQMTVSVDPNSPDYRERALIEFKQKMADLQQQGVTPVEIMDYLRNSILDPATRSDFDRVMTQVSDSKVSAEQAGNLAMQFMAGKYQQGASYGGGGSMKTFGVILGVVIVGVVTYFAYQYLNGKWPCDKTDTVTNTETQTETQTNTETETYTETQTETYTYTDCEVPYFTGSDNPCYSVQ
jgi:hypothetical protein